MNIKRLSVFFISGVVVLILVINVFWSKKEKDNQIKANNVAFQPKVAVMVKERTITKKTEPASVPRPVTISVAKPPTPVGSSASSTPSLPIISSLSFGGNSGGGRNGGGGRPTTKIILSITPNSFVVEVEATPYTILVNNSTIVLNSAGGHILFSDLKAGDSIKTIVPNFGSLDRTATWIQDFSI